LSNWALSGDDGQPAQDGIPNLMKYALGLSARTPGSSGLPHSGSTPLNGKSYLTLSFTDLSALSDINYNVQVSSDLRNWMSGPQYTLRIDNGTTSTATYRDLTAMQDAPRRFMRLSLTRP
jgi:alpha-L-arabinofuranosidase